MSTIKLLAERDGARLVVRSPVVGLWRAAVRVGQLVDGHSVIGEIEILGRTHPVALDGVAGRVVEVASDDDRGAQQPVGWNTVLFEIDPDVGAATSASASEADHQENAAANVFRSPSSGRFYSRPDPEKPAFVSVGATIESGQPVCMLEVMKTYSRVRYEGEKARVVAIRPRDEDDLEEGDVILELELV